MITVNRRLLPLIAYSATRREMWTSSANDGRLSPGHGDLNVELRRAFESLAPPRDPDGSPSLAHAAYERTARGLNDLHVRVSGVVPANWGDASVLELEVTQGDPSFFPDLDREPSFADAPRVNHPAEYACTVRSEYSFDHVVGGWASEAPLDATLP
jgi:hypothetical protein